MIATWIVYVYLYIVFIWLLFTYSSLYVYFYHYFFFFVFWYPAHLQDTEDYALCACVTLNFIIILQKDNLMCTMYKVIKNLKSYLYFSIEGSGEQLGTAVLWMCLLMVSWQLLVVVNSRILWFAERMTICRCLWRCVGVCKSVSVCAWFECQLVLKCGELVLQLDNGQFCKIWQVGMWDGARLVGATEGCLPCQWHYWYCGNCWTHTEQHVSAPSQVYVCVVMSADPRHCTCMW